MAYFLAGNLFYPEIMELIEWFEVAIQKIEY